MTQDKATTSHSSALQVADLERIIGRDGMRKIVLSALSRGEWRSAEIVLTHTKEKDLLEWDDLIQIKRRHSEFAFQFQGANRGPKAGALIRFAKKFINKKMSDGTAKEFIFRGTWDGMGVELVQGEVGRRKIEEICKKTVKETLYAVADALPFAFDDNGTHVERAVGRVRMKNGEDAFKAMQYVQKKDLEKMALEYPIESLVIGELLLQGHMGTKSGLSLEVENIRIERWKEGMLKPLAEMWESVSLDAKLKHAKDIRPLMENLVLSKDVPCKELLGSKRKRVL